MTMIRVIPEMLVMTSGKMSKVNGDLGTSMSDLSNVLNSIGNDYGGQLRNQVASKVGQAQGAAGGPRNHIGELTVELDTRAKLFADADGQSYAGFGDAGAPLRTPLDANLGQWGLLGNLDMRLLEAILAMGGVLGASGLGNNLVSFIGNNQGNFVEFAHDYNDLLDLALEDPQDFGRVLNWLQGSVRAGNIKGAEAYGKFLDSTLGKAVGVGIGTIFDYYDEREKYGATDEWYRSLGIALSKNAIEYGIALTPPGAVILVGNTLVQIGGKVEIGGLEGLGELVDPEHSALFQQDAANANEALDKIDLTHITRDLGAVGYDLVVESSMASSRAEMEALQHPSVENIVKASVMVSMPESAVLLDSNVRAKTFQDVGALAQSGVNVAVGLYEFPQAMNKLSNDVMTQVGGKLATEAAQTANSVWNGFSGWIAPSVN